MFSILTRKMTHRLTRNLFSIVITTLFITIGSLSSLSIQAGAAASTDTATPSKVTTGGRFMLQDQTGKIVTDEDFKGKFMLIYFGYTYCPDICPTSLQTIAHALDLLGKKGDVIQPIFISIDPQRDTVKVLREYVAAFHPRLIGLTGTEAVVNSVAKKYRVRFKKVSETGGINDDYTVDHTSSVFLMGPQGEFITRFSHATTSKQMAAKLATIIGKFTAKK